MTLIEKIRYATKVQHKELEGLLHSHKIMDGSISKQQLIDILVIHWQFNDALETLLAESPLKKVFPINHTVHLESDLKHLGINVLNIPAYNKEIEYEDELVGMLYVTIGSSLGGQMIAKQLKLKSQFKPEEYSFFTNQKKAGLLWKVFLSFLEMNEGIFRKKVVVNSAVDSFNFYITMARKRAAA